MEILDTISNLRYEGSLPEHIDGHHRNTLLCQFQAWKGADYVPQQVHAAIKWSKSNPFIVQENQEFKWQIPKGFNKTHSIKAKDSSIYIDAKGSIPLYHPNDILTGKKHKSEFDNDSSNKKQKIKHHLSKGSSKRKLTEYEMGASKKIKLTSISQDNLSSVTLRGLIWDGKITAVLMTLSLQFCGISGLKTLLNGPQDQCQRK